MVEPVVALRSVCRSFGDVNALRDFDLEVPAGTITMLLGPNGAGKTTAVRIITGALQPDSGTVRTLGSDPVADKGRARSRIGVVPARPALYDRLTGRDNLRYAAALYKVDDERAAIDESARRFGIDTVLDQRVGGYSTGMRARLALARATLHHPDLLLLDEPTAGLDPESSRAVLGLIEQMAGSGRTVVMSTHLLLEAEGLADYVLVMDRGRTLVSGHPASLTRNFWPSPTVIIEAENPAVVERIDSMEGDFVRSWSRSGEQILVEVDSSDRIADLVDLLSRAGARLTRVEPRRPSLEELYFEVRRTERESPDWVPPREGEVPIVPSGASGESTRP